MSSSMLSRAGSSRLANEDEIDDSSPFGAERKCTDVVCLLLFVLYWFGLVGCLIVGYQEGDPRRLLYGYETTSQGVLQCGEGEMEQKKYTVYPRVEEDILVQYDLIQEPWNIDFFGICVESCPKQNDAPVCNTEGTAAVNAAMAASGGTWESVIMPCLNTMAVPQFCSGSGCCASTAIAKGCFGTPFDTTSVFYRCLPEYHFNEEVVSTTCKEFALLGNYDSSSPCSDYGTAVENVCEVSEGRWEAAPSEGGCAATALAEACGKCMKRETVTQSTAVEPEESNVLYDSFNSAAREFDRYMGDLENAAPVVFGAGVGVSFVAGLFYVVAMYCAAGLMVWASVVLMVVSFILMTLFCYIKAGIISEDITNSVGSRISDALGSASSVTVGENVSSSTIPQFLTKDEDDQSMYEVAAYTMSVITVILIVIVLGLFNRIRRAVRILSIASSSIRQNPCLVLFPFVTAVLVVGVFGFWFVTTAFLASAGDFSLAVPGTDIEINSNTTAAEIGTFQSLDLKNVAMIYVFFGLLWSYQFIQAFSTVAVGGAVGIWYWVDEEDDSSLAAAPVRSSIKTAMRYHLGSMAFGSLIVAIIEFIRYIAAYIDSKTKKIQQDSQIMKALFCVLHCCLMCLEKCIKFITNNAFIVCALYGKNFCSSTRHAFNVVLSNLAQVATVTFLGDIVALFGQLLICCFSSLCCWYVLDNSTEFKRGGEKELDQTWFPVLATAILAWPVGGAVLSIYGIAIDTILLSYCQDHHLGRKKGGGHATRSPEDLKAMIEEEAAANPENEGLEMTASKINRGASSDSL